jgi:hypothetical protein
MKVESDNHCYTINNNNRNIKLYHHYKLTRTTKMPGYYDIDSILAEDEWVPCRTLFDFSHLSHLDPENNIPISSTTKNSNKRRSSSSSNNNNNNDDNDNDATMLRQKQHRTYLPESSRINMPIWSIRKWADLNFIQIGIPKQYRLKARERLEAADTVQMMDIRKRHERFFECGKMLTELIESSSVTVKKALRPSGPRLDRERAKRMNEIDYLVQESNKIKITLLNVYKGQRMAQTLDWALSSVGDDVTMYTCKLTDIERRLFRAGAIASNNHQCWKLHGNRRLYVGQANTVTTTVTTIMNGCNSNTITQPSRAVSPDDHTTNAKQMNQLPNSNKRIRSY